MQKIIDKIKLFLFDLDGTLYFGDKEIEGAFDTVNRLRDMGKTICYLTNNSSRSSLEYVNKLTKMGLTANIDDIVSSTKATMNYLKKNHFAKSLCLVATPAVREEFMQNGFTLADNGDIAVLTFDTNLTYKDITTFASSLMEGKPYIATHPDMVCPYKPHSLVDIGSFILMFEGATGRKPDVICGKPHTPMADYVKELYGISASEVAMCGDRLYTDIRFGLDNGFTSILVLSGETTRITLESSEMKPTLVLESIKDIFS